MHQIFIFFRIYGNRSVRWYLSWHVCNGRNFHHLHFSTCFHHSVFQNNSAVIPEEFWTMRDNRNHRWGDYYLSGGRKGTKSWTLEFVHTINQMVPTFEELFDEVSRSQTIYWMSSASYWVRPRLEFINSSAVAVQRWIERFLRVDFFKKAKGLESRRKRRLYFLWERENGHYPTKSPVCCLTHASLQDTFYVFAFMVVISSFAVAFFLAKVVGVRIREYPLNVDREWRDARPANPFRFPWNWNEG